MDRIQVTDRFCFDERSNTQHGLSHEVFHKQQGRSWTVAGAQLKTIIWWTWTIAGSKMRYFIEKEEKLVWKAVVMGHVLKE